MMLRWLRGLRERDDLRLFKAASPLPEIDPIDELARIVGRAQESDGKDERRFHDLARSLKRGPRSRMSSATHRGGGPPRMRVGVPQRP
jgi:hypothetical protein